MTTTAEPTISEVLRLHWKDLPEEPVYAIETCNCAMTLTRIEGAEVINAGCPRHGIRSWVALRIPRR